MSNTISDLTKFLISEDAPLNDYKRLMKEYVEVNVTTSHEVTQSNIEKIGKAARDMIWKQLFEKDQPTEENLNNAFELLKQYKSDACFHSPYAYNEWIPKVRDELLKRNMIDFWRDYVVKSELGPCNKRDSDFFDDDDDDDDDEDATAKFYEYGGCRAPFKKLDHNSYKPLDEVKISLETPLNDYKKLMQEYVNAEEYFPDSVSDRNLGKITTEARAVIWKLLFENEKGGEENAKNNLIKAAELMKQYKNDACFHCPGPYNEWIPKVRDELLKRGMIDFWSDEIVKFELGPCWARDSDFFDDFEDTSINAFYAHAGCVAPFSEIENEYYVLKDAHISLDDPLNDYKTLMKDYVEVNQHIPDEVISDNVKKISTSSQETIWKLLFGTQKPTDVDITKALELLKLYKSDSCFYGPYEYDSWIPSVRDELLKRSMFDFWRDGIVKNELGPCSSRESDYFDGDELAEVATFYNYGGCKAPFDINVDDD